jgi:signal transduction histidine kinase
MGGMKARSGRLFPHLLSYAALIFPVAMLIAVAAWRLGEGGLDPASTSMHLTNADWQVTQQPAMQAPPSTVDSKTLPNTWNSATLPRAFSPAVPSGTTTQSATGMAQEVSTTWIRLSSEHTPLPNGPLALYSPRIKTDGTIAIYVDGKLTHQEQQQGPMWNSLFTPLWMELGEAVNGAPPQEILIRVQHPAASWVGMSSLWMGNAAGLQRAYDMRLWLQRELPAMLSAAFLAVGVFSLVVWFRRRHETSYLLFFNVAATSFVAHMHYYVGMPIANNWFAWLTINSLLWLVAALHFFLCHLHGRPLKWLTRALVPALLVIGVSTLPLLPDTSSIAWAIYAIILLTAGTVVVVGAINAWNRTSEGRVLVIGLGFCALVGVPDWFLHNNIMSPEGWFTGAYTNAITFGMFTLLMYHRYVNAIAEVERTNASLAQRLQAREAELARSHRLLLEAELRQTISDERQRLMLDMHDGLGSSLISAIRSVERGNVDDAKISQILKDCLDDLKLTIDSMEPVEADLLLLLATLRFRLEPRLEDTGIVLSWNVQELPTLPWLDPSNALHILRIVQESIANILRHAQASEIRVSTSLAESGIHVTIEDNGRGFDVDKTLGNGTGRGLHNQRRRALALKGSVTWNSTPMGTRFTLWLPLDPASLSPAPVDVLE